MLNTVYNILFPHCLQGLLHQHLVALLYQTAHFPCSQLLEFTLNYGESELDRVPLWRIRYVVAPSEAELTHFLLGLVGPVDRELKEMKF